MGYGQEMDGCGKFMKFSMFVANFIIFVSETVFYNTFRMLISCFICKGWRLHCTGFGHLDTGGQIVCHRATGYKSVSRRRLYPCSNRGCCVSCLISGVCRFRSRSSMYATYGKYTNKCYL